MRVQTPNPIILEDEITTQFLKDYEAYLHKKAYPAHDRTEVEEVVIDGHQKVACRCEKQTATAGRPGSTSRRGRRVTRMGA